MAVGAVTLGVFLTPFESLLPDAHDRSASVVSSQALPDPGIVSGDVSVERASRPMDRSSIPTKGRPFRVDHCSHSHYLSLGARASVAMIETHAAALETSSPKLIGVLLSPRHRPPIA